MGQRVQEFGKLIDRGAPRGLGVEAAVHRRPEGGRDAPVGADRVSATFELLVRSPGLGFEGSSAGGGVEEHGADAPDVGRLAEEAAAGLLGGHVLTGPYTSTTSPSRWSGDTEVDHLGYTLGSDDVGWLQVQM